jgi:hypothetical protein
VGVGVGRGLTLNFIPVRRSGFFPRYRLLQIRFYRRGFYSPARSASDKAIKTPDAPASRATTP